MFVTPESFTGGDVRHVRWIFAAATLAGSALLYWVCMRLKSVSLRAHTLVISNYRDEIEVPLHDVEGVSGSLMVSPELVWLRFCRGTRFGTKIVFMPKLRFTLGFSRPPLVARLRTMISAIRGLPVTS